MKTLILCADDFGQNKSISEGILELAQMGRLSAVSCMVNGDDWPNGIETLKTCGVQLGLHLNFTFGKPLKWGIPKLPSLASFLMRIYGPFKLDQDEVFQEIMAQIEKFKADVGFYPQFIDGHQHVHQLLIVRELLLQALQILAIKPWIRTTYTSSNRKWSHFFNWKRWLLYFLGGSAFAKRLKQLGYQVNHDFSGDYTFNQKNEYLVRFRGFLSELKDKGLIMCHPGKSCMDKNDKISIIRPDEYSYFKSDAFLNDLKQGGFELGQLH